MRTLKKHRDIESEEVAQVVGRGACRSVDLWGWDQLDAWQ